MRYNDLIALRDLAEGQCEEALFRDEELRDGTVVCDEGGDDANSATGLGEVGLAHELASGEDGECSSQAHEQGNEADVLPQSSQEHEECEHEPGDQINSKSVGELFGSFGICVNDAAAWNQDGGIAHPESTVRGERSGAKDVATGEFPHPGEELDETTSEDCHTNDDVGCCDPASLDIEEGEDEGR